MEPRKMSVTSESLVVLPHIISQKKVGKLSSAASHNFQFPHREPSPIKHKMERVLITADMTTCKDCPCFKKEAPYETPAKIRICNFNPRTLYELAADAVDSLEYPKALDWTPLEVASWISSTLGLPQYANAFLINNINGRKLLSLENPSMLPCMNINEYSHVQLISEKVRKLFGTELVEYNRSIGLPPRKPLTHCTIFKSKTTAHDGDRMNATRSDVLRMMQIINPAPVHRNHWELVWYLKPDYPKTKFGRVKAKRSREHIPIYVPKTDPDPGRYEVMVPRKFKIQSDLLTPSKQFIWVDTRKYPIKTKDQKTKEFKEKARKKRQIIPKETRLFPKVISSTGLSGQELALARRLQPRQKFFPKITYLPDDVSRKSSRTTQGYWNKEPIVVYKSKKM